MNEDKEQNKSVKSEEKGPISALNGDSIKTTVTSYKNLIEEKLLQLKDLATMEVLLPVEARARHRLKSLKELSQARHIKVRGKFKTYPPVMHATSPIAEKITNDEINISFGVYATDKYGNKKCFENYTDVVDRDGNKFKRLASAEYRVDYEVVEKIITGKPIVREIIKMEVQ